MAKNCVRCGKKLSILGKVETKDGYICKQCAKKYKVDLENKKIDFANKTLEELDASVEKKKKASTRTVFIIIAAFLVFGGGLLALGGMLEDGGSNDPAKTETTITTEETTAPTTTTTKATTTTTQAPRPSIHSTTETEHNESDGRPTYTIYAVVDDTEENKADFISDAKILLADYLGCSDEQADKLIEEAVAGEIAEYGSTGISYSDHLGGHTYEVFVCDDWRFW